MAGTFVITRIDMKKMLSAKGISDKNIDSMLGSLDKMHRHVNVTVFVMSLQKIGLKQKDILNILRRVGIDDVTISSIFDKVDEGRIQESFGRVVELSVE